MYDAAVSCDVSNSLSVNESVKLVEQELGPIGTQALDLSLLHLVAFSLAVLSFFCCVCFFLPDGLVNAAGTPHTYTTSAHAYTRILSNTTRNI